MGLPLITVPYYNNSTALNLRDSPTKVPNEAASLSLNMDYSTDGAFFTRNGSTIQNRATPMDQLLGLAAFDYRKSDGTQVSVIQNGSKIYHSLTTPVAQVTGLNATAIPDMEFQVTLDDEYLFWGNGIDDNLKFDGTTWSKWNIDTPGNPTVTLNGAGTLVGDFSYYIAFVRYDVGTGVIEQISDLNPVAQDITAASNEIRITRPASTDPQVNGWVIYRASPTSNAVYYQLVDSNLDPVIVPIATTFYDDDLATDGTIEADFTNQPAPKTAIFEEYLNCMNIVDAANPTDLYESWANTPWNVDQRVFEIFDGPITCIKRIYNVLFIATDRSLWVREGTMASGATSKRLSSTIGCLNNRCADGLSYLYFVGTNKKVYAISPTDFSNLQVRVDEPLSSKVEPLFNSIIGSLLDQICIKYYTIANVGKLVISAPIGFSSNSALIVFNETQSQAVKEPVWQFWDHINAAWLQMFTFNGVTNLYSGNYSGLNWKLDDPATNGDGAEENGTAQGGGPSFLQDGTKSWTTDEFVGATVTILTGEGAGQIRTIQYNTDILLVVTENFDVDPAPGDLYTIGGYDSYHFTNWKSVTNSYDTLKQLWYIISNVNASGDYPIELIIQFDFDQTISNSTVLNLQLSSGNSIWGDFDWGDGIWGAFAVFQTRLRQGGRFRAIRLGFRSRKSGQPFQVNGFSLSVQDKGLFYGSAS